MKKLFSSHATSFVWNKDSEELELRCHLYFCSLELIELFTYCRHSLEHLILALETHHATL